MQTRLLATLAGGLLGAGLSSTVNAYLGLSPTVALVACSAGGLVAGYVISILFDVFTSTGADRIGSDK